MTATTAPPPAAPAVSATTPTPVVEDLTVHVRRQPDRQDSTYTTTAILDGGRDRPLTHRRSLAALYGVPTTAVSALPGHFTYAVDLAGHRP